MSKYFKLFGLKVADWGDSTPIDVSKQVVAPEKFDPKILPSGRTSIPPEQNQYNYNYGGNTQILLPDYYLDLIPYIRKLASTNPNISQALNNIVELGNTGHNIKFDPSVEPDQIVKMQQHLDRVVKTWTASKASANGIVDKFMRQLMTSGALSQEWVPKRDLSGIQMVATVNAETVRWGYDKKKNTYKPYQVVLGTLIPNDNVSNLIELNPNTFKYFAINGDTDIPYGIPPYLAAIDSLHTQKLMMDNIKFLIKQVGIAGFMEMLIDKPERVGNESEDQYIARLNAFLDEAKERALLGFRDGISVGYEGDATFKFNSTSKSMGGIQEFYVLNDLLLSSGLNMDPSMLGKNYGASESQITIIFTKLLSQLNTIQQIVGTCLEYGYELELRLAGFQFNTLKVEFNPSTALDELKYQQAEEIRIRNANQLYADGIISQEQYAHILGYDKPNQKEPRFIPTSRETPQDAAARRAAENRKKDEGDKTSRRKKKDQDIKDK